MIEIKDKQIVIDGKPRLIISGEVHYFRLKRDEWQDRLDKLRATGCNAVAAYIPWLCHEPFENRIDLVGATRPELDVGAFIDLCKENDLYFIARPGPFVMAELKNEGLPYWVYTKHPEIVPISWDGKRVPTRTVDYLAPGFLQEARHWYEAIMKVIAPRLQPNGGNIIAVQLDNEIGMLSWVSNSPDLTDRLLDDFTGWLHERYNADDLKVRYPFPLDNAVARNIEMRSPREEFAAELMRDLGHYMRRRFAQYVATLRGYAEEFGVKGVPFVINIHGTDQRRGLSYPIGISQLYEAYTQDAGYIAGSDHYIGEVGVSKVQDLYLINALEEASQNPSQPLTSVEFEAGSGDYGDNFGSRNDPCTVDHKTRMCIAQGNRLLNYYLFSGGINYHLPEPVDDGNDRIAFTGERHGFGAPVNPEGKLSYNAPRLSQVVHSVMAVADKLAAMDEERDDVAFAFIPDYYMTESWYPGSDRMRGIVANLEANRGQSAWENVARAMLLANYRFGAVDIQNAECGMRKSELSGSGHSASPIPQSPIPHSAFHIPHSTAPWPPVLVLPSAQYMDGGVQQKVVDYLSAGGRVLLYGEVPLFDMEGRPCRVLAEALGLNPTGSRRASSFYYLSLYADGWAAPRPEIRTHYAQVSEPTKGEVLLRVVGTGEACGFDIPVGQGRAIVITAEYRCDVPFIRTILETLGAKAGLGHDCPYYGIFMTTTASKEGERFLHIVNLDGFDKPIHIFEHGQKLLDGRSMTLRSREGVMLPLNVSLGDVRVVYSTAEIVQVMGEAIRFRLTQPQDVIAIETGREIAPCDDYTLERHGKTTLISSRKHAAIDDCLIVRWRED